MYKVIENHPNDSRVKFREDNVFQTLSSRCGTGGGNVPMVMNVEGVGVNENIAGTLDANYFKGCGVRGGTERTAVCVGNGQLDQIKPTTTARTLNCMHDQQCVMENKTVRRLTPIEAERLQGWPEEKNILVLDLKDERMVMIRWLDLLNNHVQSAAVKCPNEQRLVGIVEKSRCLANALSVEKNLLQNNQNINKPAQKNVPINSEDNIQEIHNLWELLRNACSVEKNLENAHQEQSQDFVPFDVPTNTTQERIIPNGKVELQRKEKLKQLDGFGINVLKQFGNEIKALAKDVGKYMTEQVEDLQYITSDLTEIAKKQGMLLKTLSFFAQNVTLLHILKRGEIVAISLENNGYTDIPCNGKPASDSARYKALGNGMAQPCARWIIQRIVDVTGGEKDGAGKGIGSGEGA